MEFDIAAVVGKQVNNKYEYRLTATDNKERSFEGNKIINVMSGNNLYTALFSG
jgi:hypothetical protein